MMKLTLALFLVLALVAAGCKKEGDGPRAIDDPPDGPTDRQPDRDKRPPTPDRVAELAGDWQAEFDGSELRIQRAGDDHVGRYTQLSSYLKDRHFTAGEVCLRGLRSGDGKTFKGELKWRSSDKREEWRPAVLTLQGDSFTISPGYLSPWTRLSAKAAP